MLQAPGQADTVGAFGAVHNATATKGKSPRSENTEYL